MDLTPQQLVDIACDAAEADAAAPPPGVWTRTLAAAAARPQSHPAWDGDGLSSLSMFMRTASELAALLDTLSPDEWARHTRVADASVHQLVNHLAGVERYLLGQLGRRPAIAAPRREDHFPVALAAASDLASLDGGRLSRAWWLEVMDLIAAAGELGPDHVVEFHHLAGSVRGLLVVRTFELWTHDDDIRHATGRGPNDLDDARLSAMSNALLEALPLGMALAGTAHPGCTARITLTEPGDRRVFDVGLAPGEVAGEADITIGTNALDLCRLAANRRAIGDLVLAVEGDRSLLEPVLAGAAAFALD